MAGRKWYQGESVEKILTGWNRDSVHMSVVIEASREIGGIKDDFNSLLDVLIGFGLSWVTSIIILSFKVNQNKIKNLVPKLKKFEK